MKIDRTERYRLRLVACLLLFAASAGDLIAEQPWRYSLSSADAVTGPRLREGTRVINRQGTIRQIDTRWYFLPMADADSPVSTGLISADSSAANASNSPPAHFGGSTAAAGGSRPASLEARELRQTRLLENLALQRIVRLIGQDATDSQWVISGVVTEFFGENYLLIEAATRAPVAGGAPP